MRKEFGSHLGDKPRCALSKQHLCLRRQSTRSGALREAMDVSIGLRWVS